MTGGEPRFEQTRTSTERVPTPVDVVQHRLHGVGVTPVGAAGHQLGAGGVERLVVT